MSVLVVAGCVVSGELMVDELEYVVVSGGLDVLGWFHMMLKSSHITGCITVCSEAPTKAISNIVNDITWKKTVTNG